MRSHVDISAPGFWAAAFVCMAAVPVSAGVWRDTGPRAGSVTHVALHPTSLDTVYAAAEGMYVTTDGGGSWSRLGQLPIADIVFDRHTPSVVYARASRGIYKSTDSGVHWTQIASFPAVSLTIAPSDASLLYAGAKNGDVYLSADGGATWSSTRTGSPWHVTAVAVNPHDPSAVVVGTSGEFEPPGDGVYVTTDGGETWQHILLGVSTNVSRIETVPGNGATLYLATQANGYYSGRGVYKSTDGGRVWAPMSAGLPQYASIGDLAVDPANPSIVYAAEEEGLYRTVDGGREWSRVDLGADVRFVWEVDVQSSNGDAILVGTEVGALLSTDFGKAFSLVGTLAIGVGGVVVDHHDPQTVYALERAVYKSTDGGDTWDLSLGYVGYGQTIVQDPTNRDVLYVGTYSPTGQVLKTADGGETWSESLGDVAINAIAVAPSDAQVVFAVGLDEPHVGGVFRSRDAGGAWTKVAGTIGHAVAIDPRSAATVFVGGDQFLRRSDDGGETWSPSDSGLTYFPPFDYATTIVVDPTEPDRMYCGTTKGGVFMSDDGGRSWSHAAKGLTTRDVRVLAVDPADAAILYAGTWGGGVFVSDNRGDSWRAAEPGAGNGFVLDMGIAPDAPSVVWVAGGAGLWKSQDRLVAAFSAVGCTYERGVVCVRWSVTDATGIDGYDVYRRDAGGDDLAKLNPEPMPAAREGTFVDRNVEAGGSYVYRVVAVVSYGEWPSPETRVTVPATQYELFQNYPNPFNPSTQISFVLPRRERALLTVHDVSGALVATLSHETRDAGLTTVPWDGTDARGHSVAAGVYFYRLRTDDGVLTKKMVLLK